MTRLRLVYSKTGRYVTSTSGKNSRRRPLALPTLQLLSWKIEMLSAKRPAAIEVLENIVDDMLARAGNKR